MTGEVINVTTMVGALSNAKRPLFPAPANSNGGGLTVLAWNVVQGGSTNSSLRLTKGTLSGGTYTANGTVSSALLGGTGSPFAANIVQTGAVDSAHEFVSGAEWLALEETNVAACNTVAIVNIQYVMGRQ